MARIVYALNQSLDGFVDHDKFAPDPVLFRHFIEDVASLAGSIYGRRMYETMRYWDTDDPEWTEDLREYAAAWRAMPKWVVSRTLDTVGPNATLVSGDVAEAVRDLKDAHDGVIEVSGPELAGAIARLGLIDAFHIYLHPVVVGSGKRYFDGTAPRLRLEGSDRIGEEVIRLRYVPA